MTAHRERLAIGAALVIIALTAAAFWLSYAHLHAVAASHGLASSFSRAWAWPATLDLFIVAGELLMLRASLARTTDWWAIGLTVVGSGGSIALNVFGVGGNDPLAYVVAAVPPTAALLAFGALMRQVHSLLAEHAELASTAPAAAIGEPEPSELGTIPEVPAATRVAELVRARFEICSGSLNLTIPEPARTVAPKPEPTEVPNPQPEPATENREARTPRTANLSDRAAKKAAQVQQVLNLMDELGYDAVTLPVVQNRTGMTKTTAYHRLTEARELRNQNAA